MHSLVTTVEETASSYSIVRIEHDTSAPRQMFSSNDQQTHITYVEGRKPELPSTNVEWNLKTLSVGKKRRKGAQRDGTKAL